MDAISNTTSGTSVYTETAGTMAFSQSETNEGSLFSIETTGSVACNSSSSLSIFA